jgi:formylglycine-generating enzyme required for sulfatase activity
VGSSDGNAVPATCVVTVKRPFGDVNGDGRLTSVDITCIYNYLLNGDETFAATSDIDGDGYITSVDITVMYNILLNGNPQLNNETEYTVNGVTFKMISVDGGTFTMGATAEQGSDAYDWEYPTHQVTLSGFSIGQTEVTQELWRAVMGSNPSYFSGNLQRPVECVSWNDCQQFIAKLNEMTGKQFRLPTEAEWEYAARGGNRCQGYKYSGSNNIDDVAWYWDNIPSQSSGTTGYGTQTVATKQPNELGIYDMSGNVCEWCSDWYGSYSSAPKTNPTGPVSGSYRVDRGGSWGFDAKRCRVSSRIAGNPDSRGMGVGLRLAL